MTDKSLMRTPWKVSKAPPNPRHREPRFVIVGTFDPKTEHPPILALNIASQPIAQLMASAPRLRDKLAAIKAACEERDASAVATSTTTMLTDEILRIIEAQS